MHLKLVPGSDVALANGLLHILVRDRLIDEDYIRQRTDGFARVRLDGGDYWPQQVERITGVPEQRISCGPRISSDRRERRHGASTARGAEQHAQASRPRSRYINIALALGQVGKPCGGYGCPTGQGNGQGGREHGQKADQLPGYRKIDDEADRRSRGGRVGVPADSLPGPGLSAYELLDALGQKDGVRALLVMGSNPVVSAPNASHIESRLRSLDTLIVADFFLSETAALARRRAAERRSGRRRRGRSTNLEGRVLLRRGGARRRRACAPTSTSSAGWRRGSARRGTSRSTTPRAVFDELRRASAGGRRLFGHHLRTDRSASGRVLALSPSVKSGQRKSDAQGRAERHAAHVRRSLLHAERRARFHAVRHGGPAEEPDREYPIYLTHRPHACAVSVGHADAPHRRTDRSWRPSRSRSCTRGSRAVTASRTAIGSRWPRARGCATFVARVTNTIREDTVFVPFHWGGAGSANRLTNPALDPTSRMPEFKVCAARICQ